ncbi:MAG: efflux RND transporter periplasmic adaptor subunit [Desulfuromonadales bacterium]
MIFRKSALFFVLLALLTVTGCNEPAEESPSRSLPPVAVQVETLALSTVPVHLELSGTLQAVDHATIAARVAGQVVTLPIHIGSQVKAGELLVKLSAEEINARVRQAEVQLKQARRDLARESKLLAVEASTPVRVKTLEEQVQTREAAFREAQTILGYTEIKAPFAGTVTDKLVEVGDLAVPGTALLKLERDTALEVVIAVPETLSQDLSLGSRLPLTVPAAGRSLEAQVSEISPTVDPDSRTTRVKLMLPEATGLRSGQFARVALVSRQPTSLLIARNALRQMGQMQQVFVAEGDTARMRLVRTGAEYEERIEILSGLRTGERVILDPPANLHDGQPLVIADGSQQ